MKFLSVMCAVAVLTGLELQAQPRLADGIRVVVSDSIVTYIQIEDYIGPLASDLARQYQNQPQVLEKKLGVLRDDNMEILVEHDLILHEFATAGYSLPESVIDDFVQQQIRRRYGDRATLTKTLQEEGITYDRFRQQIRDQFIIEQMRYKNIADAIIISPHKIETYYVGHTNEFKVEERVKLRMIVLNKPADDTGQTRKLTEEILTKLNEGSSFSDLARVYSQGLHSSEGGDWGWVEKFNADGAPVLRKELFDVAFTLKPGDKSGVIDTPEACYLMLVEEVSPEHIQPLGEVRGGVERKLLAMEQDRLQKQWIERLKKKTFVRYFE